MAGVDATAAAARVSKLAALPDVLLRASSLACGYDGRAVVCDVSFLVRGGETLSILGPNGVGKTTLFKTLLGFLPPIAGAIELAGQDVASWSRRQFAQAVAYIPQQHVPTFPFSVSEFVLMGRTPSLGTLSVPGAHDERVAAEALARLGIEHLAGRDYTSLSGGERQMVLVARALAQQPKLLVMDEPCASLDLGNQVRLLRQVLDLAADGLAVVMTTHDPNHAFMLDGAVLCMGRDGSMSFGETASMLDERLLADLYGVDVGVVPAVDASGTTVLSAVPFLAERDGDARKEIER